MTIPKLDILYGKFLKHMPDYGQKLDKFTCNPVTMNTNRRKKRKRKELFLITSVENEH